MGILDEIRSACAEVAGRATFVQLCDASLETLADQLAPERPRPSPPDPAHHFEGDDGAKLAFYVTLDTLNFGSGYFPKLRKPDGLSGYFTIASALKAQFDRCGPWDAPSLAEVTAEECTRIFDQAERGPEIRELMELFATALRDLGTLLSTRYDGQFSNLLEDAEASAEKLVGILSEMRLFRDLAAYGSLAVPFYKRAQILAADLHAAFGGTHFGRFDDLARLTLFADNLIPHVLRCLGVLRYDPALAARIDSSQLISPGSPEEVELRACAVHAVERLVAALAQRGVDVCAWELDSYLWNYGQRPDIKATPRHRTRTPFY